MLSWSRTQLSSWGRRTQQGWSRTQLSWGRSSTSSLWTETVMWPSTSSLPTSGIAAAWSLSMQAIPPGGNCTGRATTSNEQRNRICEEAFHHWGFQMMDHWKTIQNVSHNLNNVKQKKILRGEGQRLLDAISTSTQHKQYHKAFCPLVRLVEARLFAKAAPSSFRVK